MCRYQYNAHSLRLLFNALSCTSCFCKYYCIRTWFHCLPPVEWLKSGNDNGIIGQKKVVLSVEKYWFLSQLFCIKLTDFITCEKMHACFYKKWLKIYERYANKFYEFFKVFVLVIIFNVCSIYEFFGVFVLFTCFDICDNFHNLHGCSASSCLSQHIGKSKKI